MYNNVIEIWKDVIGYEDCYQISNYGRVKSLYNYKRNGTNILKPKIKNNYYQIGLRKNGTRKWYSIHRLVAQAFIPNPNNLPQVNHKDENKLNNNINNLEWCTASYNNTYGTRMEKVINKTGKPVIQFDLQGNFIKEYQSISQAAREMHISAGNIHSCCTNKPNYKKVKGFVWKFKSEVM